MAAKPRSFRWRSLARDQMVPMVSLQLKKLSPGK
jgi:hypothetical protein